MRKPSNINRQKQLIHTLIHTHTYTNTHTHTQTHTHIHTHTTHTHTHTRLYSLVCSSALVLRATKARIHLSQFIERAIDTSHTQRLYTHYDQQGTWLPKMGHTTRPQVRKSEPRSLLSDAATTQRIRGIQREATIDLVASGSLSPCSCSPSHNVEQCSTTGSHCSGLP